MALIYYIVVGLLFFRTQLKTILATRSKTDDSVEEFDNFTGPESQLETPVEKDALAFSEEEYEEIGAFSENLKALISDMPEAHHSKAELLAELQAIIEQYQKYHIPIVKAAIAAQIIEESERQGNIRLKQNEVDDLWGKA
jgi:hypothetical protein